MGFDTYLEVNGDILLMWRKYASPLPRLLFQHSDSVVATSSDADDNCPVHISFRASVDRVRENLEIAGLGWHASISAYSEIRVDGAAAGMALGRSMASGADSEESLRAVEQFRARPPRRDLEAMSKFLSNRLLDEAVLEIDLFRELNYDGTIESVYESSMGAFDAAKGMADVDALDVVRAVESWAVLNRDAPLLAWPMLLCVLLHGLDGSMVVEFDLSEAGREAGVTNLEEGRDYAATYWRQSSEFLASYASTMGRLFSVLASFDSKLGRDFWFARAADLLGRLNSGSSQMRV